MKTRIFGALALLALLAAPVAAQDPADVARVSALIDSLGTEAVRSRGFIRAAETQLTKTADLQLRLRLLLDSLMGAPVPDPDPDPQPDPDPDPTPSGLYPNRPAGLTTYTENDFNSGTPHPTGAGGNSWGFTPGWSGNTWEHRTNRGTYPEATCPGLPDDGALRHNHPGDGSAQADYGGSFDYTAPVPLIDMYVAICTFVNGTITGGGSNHGIKLDFARTLRNGADIFPTYNSQNYFGVHYQNGISEPDQNNIWRFPDGAEFEPHWFEYFFEGPKNGQPAKLTVWIDGEQVHHNPDISGVQGFRGWQIYRNTDEGAGRDQHYLYTSHFYLAGNPLN